MAKYKRTRRFKRRGTTLKELSGVDKPAQEGATMIIMKRDTEQQTEDTTAESEVEQEIITEKRAQLTTSVSGHSHLIDDDSAEHGSTSYSWDLDNESGHSHDWVKKDDGTIVIGEAAGHSHDLVDLTKGEAEWSATKTQAADVSADITEEAEMTEENTAPEVTEPEVEKAKDEVVYTADDGTEYRKSASPELVAMAKRLDAAERVAKAERDERYTMQLTKRAEEELSHLPGDAEVKVAMLKALDTIDDAELRGKVSELLKAADGAAETNFEEIGVAGESDEESPSDRLNKMAQEYADKHSVPFGKAYNAVLGTPEGQAVYNELRSN